MEHEIVHNQHVIRSYLIMGQLLQAGQVLPLQCQSSDSTALYEIGRSDADHAYALCKSHEDSSTSCIMWVMK